LQICIRDIPVPSTYADEPPGFDDWFRRACEREPRERFQSARELAEALRSALGLDVSSSPESRWAPAGERLLWSKAAVRSDSEEARRDDIDTERTLNSQPEPALTPAPSTISPVTAHDRTIADETPRYVTPDDWKVVPVEQRFDADSQPPASHDPLGDTHGPSSATKLFWVALLAITFGGGAVFGARELGLVSWGQKEKPLRVIRAPEPARKKPARSAMDKEPATPTDRATPTEAPRKRDRDPEAAPSPATSGAPQDAPRSSPALSSQPTEVPPPPIPPPLPEEQPEEPSSPEPEPRLGPGPEPVLPPELTPSPSPTAR
jgi:hypothetical protein